MKEPLVSVKMITYNHEPYIAQAIEGVLGQETSFPFELVIGEDCSTDGTREIVFDYQKKYPDIIRVITSDKNVGARKNGLRTEKACRGKYIAYCEGDDYWHHPQKLEKQVDYLERHPECGLIHSDYNRHFVTSGKTIRNFNQCMNNKPPANTDICAILRGGRFLYVLTCTVLVRKDLLEQIVNADPYLYKDGGFLIGDTPRWAEISYRAKVAYIDESLATYNVLEESASKSKDFRKILRFGKSNRELFLYLIDKYDLPTSERIIHEKEWRKHTLRLAFHEKNAQLGNEVRMIERIYDGEIHGAKIETMYWEHRLLS